MKDITFENLLKWFTFNKSVVSGENFKATPLVTYLVDTIKDFWS